MRINTSLLNQKEKYIIGVSGGVDSMALLDILYKRGYQLYVCHVNYHLRYDSNEDQAIVSTYCKIHNIPYYSKEIDKEEYQESNFQMQARNIRYAFYRDIGIKVGTNKVVLGHHLGDVIETIYMQVERNNKEGYLGIQEISEVMRMEVYRPLLQVYKQELYEYCQEHTILYHEDYTNFQTEFTRDYVRNVVLKQYPLEQKEELLKMAKEHNKKYEQLQQQVKPYLDLYHVQGYIRFKEIHPSLWSTCLYQMLKEWLYPPTISTTLLEEIIKQIQSTKPNIQISLPLNTVFIKEYDNSYVLNNKSQEGYCLNYPYLVYDRHEYFYLAREGHINTGIYVQDTDFPITIRTYRSGDKIATSSGTKKIARLFIDNKIPKRLRQIWPIVERTDGTIILVPNLAKNINYLYTKPNIFVIKYKDLGE